MPKPISISKLRSLQQCTSPRGTFTCLALDHRQNLRKANPVFVSDVELSRFKQDVTASLGAYGTAILLDPEVSAAQAIASGALPGQTAFVVAVESTGYGGDATARRGQIIPGWSVEKSQTHGGQYDQAAGLITIPIHPLPLKLKILPAGWLPNALNMILG